MDSIESYIERNLTEKRKKHTYGVAQTAEKLARQYGACADKARTAALFHDMFRSAPQDVLNMYVRQLGLDSRYLDNANLAHGPVAAIMMERDYHISDADLLHAVRYHTTGRADMSLLEKILYLADAIEPGRDYPGVGRARQLAEESLDRACLFCMERSITYIRQQGLFLHEDTINARDYLREQLEKKGDNNGL